MVKGKTVGQSRTAAVSMGLGEDSADYYSSLCMPVPVLATLNASGGLKFVRLRAFASTQTFYANIPAAHTSGSPRSMSLSASGNTLCISYASAIQVYSVTHHMKEGNPYNVILRFNYKVLLSFAPHYVSTLTSFRPRDTVVSQRVMEVDEQVGVTSASKGNHAQVEDILVAGVDGDIGVVSTLSRYQKKMAMFEDNAKAQSEQFFRMGSSPCPVAAAPHLAPHKASRSGLNCRTYLSIVTVPDASIVATITTGGALIISHADSGITLPFPDTVTPTNCSALAASKTLLAVGSNCGRVCIYEARSMKVVKIVFMPTSGNKNAFALATRISSLLFITGHEDAEFLAVTLGDGSVCVSSVPSLNRVRAGVDDDAVVEAGDRMLRRISSQHLAKSTNGTGGSEAVTSTGGQLYLCDCFDSPNTFGVIRGDVLDLFSVEAPVSVTKSVDIVGGLAGSGAPIVARIGKVRLIDGHCEDLKKGNPRSPSTLRVYDVHIRRVERKLIVTAISASARSLLQPSANADLWVTVGSAELQRWGRGMAEVDVNKVLNVAMTRRVALGLDYRQVISRSGGIRVNSHYSYFSRNICHVFTATGLLFLDLDVIYKNSQVCGSSGKEHNSILDISTVTRGHLDFSSLCGSDKESAIPGDGQRSLQESAVVAISRKVVTKTVAAPEGDESGYDSGLKEIILVDVEETAFVCRSYPSPVLLRARI